jgi:hypothetical protein
VTATISDLFSERAKRASPEFSAFLAEYCEARRQADAWIKVADRKWRRMIGTLGQLIELALIEEDHSDPKNLVVGWCRDNGLGIIAEQIVWMETLNDASREKTAELIAAAVVGAATTVMLSADRLVELDVVDED